MPVRMVFRMTGSNVVHREFHPKGACQPRNARFWPPESGARRPCRVPRRSVHAAEDDAVGSERDVAVSLIAVYKALGGGWAPTKHIGSDPHLMAVGHR
jgi:hypothetical protein